MSKMLFTHIMACCVTKQTTQTRTAELQRILATRRSKARQCEMKLTCSQENCS